MKNIYLLSTFMSLLLTFIFSTDMFSQKPTLPTGRELVIGTLNNGIPALTSQTNATMVLKGGLTASSTITDVSIGLDTESGKYVLLGIIGNASISGRIVELQLEGDVLRAVAGGKLIEVTCVGDNCSHCSSVASNGNLICRCDDNPAKPNAICVMHTRITISGW